MINLTIEGEPKGKARPRVCKNGIAFTPKATVNYENYVKELYILNKLPKLQGYIKAKITAYYSIPKSASKVKKAEMKHEIIRPTKKPDLDNVAKIILDSLNGIAYKDDSQVVSLQVDKYYSNDPRVELELEEI